VPPTFSKVFVKSWTLSFCGKVFLIFSVSRLVCFLFGKFDFSLCGTGEHLQRANRQAFLAWTLNRIWDTMLKEKRLGAGSLRHQERCNV
jgi:hypothetical protein